MTPATPSMTVADNGNGTATATVSGSTSGSTNEIEVVSLGASGSQTWTNAGSRISDGTVTLALANGSYLARCQSTFAGVAALDSSNSYSFSVTGGAVTSYNSPHAALAHSVCATIQGLIGTKLTGVVADSVRVRKVPYAEDFTARIDAHALPGILIVYYDRERDQGGVNDRDDIGFPLLLVFVAKDVDAAGRSDVEDNDDTFLTWRKVISDVFRNQPYQITNYAPGAVTFQTCRIEYGAINDWTRWQKDQLFVGSFSLVFELRKFRGLNPAN